MKKKILFLLFLIYPLNSFGEIPDYFFQICDFEEATKGNWVKLKNCTQVPENYWDDLRKGYVYIIPGHSSRGLSKLPEERQAELALARGNNIKTTLLSRGFSKERIFVMPSGLEIGSRVVVVYTSSSSKIDELLVKIKELENKISSGDADLQKALDDLKSRIKSIEDSSGNLQKALGDLNGRIKNVEEKRLRFVIDIVKILALPERLVMEVGFGVNLLLVPDFGVYFEYGIGYPFDLGSAPKNKFVAYSLEGGLQFRIWKGLLGDLGFLYESDMDKKFYGLRDFKGGKVGLFLQINNYVFIGAFGLVGAGSKAPPEAYRNRFTLGGGAGVGVSF